MSPSTPAAVLPVPYLLADHPALDLLNTVMMVDGLKTDLLNNDQQASTWLEQVGFGPASIPAGEDGELLSNLRTLRAAIEVLIHARREERDADPSLLNDFLRDAVPQLTWGAGQQPKLDRFHHKDVANRHLAKLAYAAAELLAEGDFSLVRKCESPDCSLMFYDRTKSHKRRWCSMALCGNRHKVAEFRKRRQGLAE
ncbi:CGNR zinc finger domain-containing protein [Pseudomonas aeruginosa]|nr:CGNR zinc finger domain-containing protein [Pseudomonas aeruginosa]